jgi:hypothetical protein
MAYTTPRTWTVNEVVTAAKLNTDLRDNIDEIQDFASSFPTALSLTSPWTNYGGDWPTAAYWKTNETVYLTGLLLISGGGDFSVIVNALPSGYRPPTNCMFCQPAAIANGSARIDVASDGVIWYTSQPSGTPSWISLTGIAFLVN